MKKFSLFIIIFAPLIALSAIGCSGGGSAPTQSAQLTNSNTTTNTSPCGPVHEMKKRKAVWSYYQCNETDDVKVTNETKDSTTGVVLGDLPTLRGMLSFRYHGLDNSQFAHLLSDDGVGMPAMGIFFKAGGRVHNWEVNWHLVSFWMKDYGLIFTKLIIQRFDTSPCINKQQKTQSFCEYFDETDFIQYSQAEVYQYDCEWDTSAELLQCVVTTVGKPNSRIMLSTSPRGPYGIIKSLTVGRNTSGDTSNENYAGTVSDFKFTVFE